MNSGEEDVYKPKDEDLRRGEGAAQGWSAPKATKKC